ncbi:MAG: hypothetical protein J7L35_00395 [Anaerolineales bacterium]|nr:hypothetical protein [Anaerolineales bacterium]
MMSFPSTIAGLNQLSADQKRETYAKIIPPQLLSQYQIDHELRDPQGRDLFIMHCPAGSSSAELALYHQADAADPILFGHITDTIHGQLHILLYGMNDVLTPRYDVDRLPDGAKTSFGTNHRNLEAEQKAMEAGLAPGQIYRGPHLFKESLRQFESFAACMGQDLFFVEPLFYHVAIIFEKYNFHYQTGKKFMTRISDGFSEGGDLLPLLNSSTPFRSPKAAKRIHLRSWAVHDEILGEPFNNVTMYRYVEKETSPCHDHTLDW